MLSLPNEFDQTVISEVLLFVWCISNGGVQFIEWIQRDSMSGFPRKFKEMIQGLFQSFQAPLL